MVETFDASHGVQYPPNAWLEISLLPDGSLTVYAWSGADSLDELVQQLEKLGLALQTKFDSPCG